MTAPTPYTIERLDLSVHREITSSLENFWLSAAADVKPYHHPMIPLLFSDFSFVLRRDGMIHAYLYGAWSGKRGFLHTIATRVSHHRQGYGSALLHHWEERARDLGVQSLWAYAVPENALSIRFLGKHGFISRKKIAVYSETERVLFRKALA